MNKTKQKCKTEKTFIKCKCKRCKKWREDMVRTATSMYISSIVTDSFQKAFNNKQGEHK